VSGQKRSKGYANGANRAQIGDVSRFLIAARYIRALRAAVLEALEELCMVVGEGGAYRLQG
jgi:hypothetical protein